MAREMRLDSFGNLLRGASWDDPPEGMDPADQEYLPAMLDTLIVIHRYLAEISGGLNAGAMLTGLSAFGNEPGGDWADVDEKEWNDLLGLSSALHVATRRRLVRLGFIEERRFGNPARGHFRVVWAAVDVALKRQLDERTAHQRNVHSGTLGTD